MYKWSKDLWGQRHDGPTFKVGWSGKSFKNLFKKQGWKCKCILDSILNQWMPKGPLDSSPGG